MSSLRSYNRLKNDHAVREDLQDGVRGRSEEDGGIRGRDDEVAAAVKTILTEHLHKEICLYLHTPG